MNGPDDVGQRRKIDVAAVGAGGDGTRQRLSIASAQCHHGKPQGVELAIQFMHLDAGLDVHEIACIDTGDIFKGKGDQFVGRHRIGAAQNIEE